MQFIYLNFIKENRNEKITIELLNNMIIIFSMF